MLTCGAISLFCHQGFSCTVVSADYSSRNGDYDRTRRAARETRQDARDAVNDAKDTVKGGYYDAKDSAKSNYYDAKHSVQDGYYDAKHSIKDSYRETKDEVKDTYNDAKDSVKGTYRETKDSIKDKYNETNRELNRSIDQAKQSWHDAMTPHSYVSSFVQANQTCILLIRVPYATWSHTSCLLPWHSSCLAMIAAMPVCSTVGCDNLWYVVAV